MNIPTCLANRFAGEHRLEYKKIYSQFGRVLMPKQSEGKRLIQIGLDRDLIGRVNDFRKANLGSAENVVVAAALEFFMEHWLNDNSGVKKRFEELQKKRRENPKAGDA